VADLAPDPALINPWAMARAYAALAPLDQEQQLASLAWLTIVLAQDAEAIGQAVDSIVAVALDDLTLTPRERPLDGPVSPRQPADGGSPS